MSGKYDLAYKKITELASLTNSAIAAGDLIPCYDASTAIVKTISANGHIRLEDVGNLDTLVTGSVASGDWIPVFDTTASTFVKVDALAFKNA